MVTHSIRKLHLNSKNFRLLIIEDSSDYASMVEYEMRDASHFEVETIVAKNLAEGRQFLAEQDFDAILLDLNLPDSEGFETFARIREASNELPIVVATCLDDSKLHGQILRNGAQDCLVKGQITPEALGRIIHHAIERNCFILELDRRAKLLEESEKRVDKLIEANADAIVIVDHEGIVRYVNQAAAEMFKRDVPSLLDEPFGFPAAAGKAVEIDIIRGNGSILIAEMRVAEIEWVGQPALLASIRDISKRKQIEKEIRELNANLEARVLERTAELKATNEELEAFSYSVSHDLRSHLSGLLGMTDFLIHIQSGKLDEVALDYLETIRSAGQRMEELIGDLLSLSQVSRADLRTEFVRLDHIAAVVIDDLHRRFPSHSVNFLLEDHLSAQGDPGLLKIVLENLLGNAWKYTGQTDGARVEFGSTYGAESNKTVFFVRDNGAGFDMKHAEKLFAAFQRLHSDVEFEGTGIGLTTVQRIIHRHGGRIWAESEVGKGATFYFTL